jgi:Astacin (Peptidase family M12A)
MAKLTKRADEKELKAVLQRLLALLGTEDATEPSDDGTIPRYPCVIQPLPRAKWVAAADRAGQINPANRPATHLLGMSGIGAATDVLPPEAIAVLTSKYWGSNGVKLTVGFMEPIQQDLRERILSHMNAWNAYANVELVYSTTDPQVRITRGSGGYKSYLGTDILNTDTNEPTMWLQGFTMDTEDSEFYRVVRHETGHTLGFPHEHTRKEIVDLIDREKAIALFMRTQLWTRD